MYIFPVLGYIPHQQRHININTRILMNSNTTIKIDRLIEETLNKLLPIAGAAGLGYLGYQAGDDITDGIRTVSAEHASPGGIFSNVVDELTGNKPVYSTPQEELHKFITPGQDGDMHKVGEAIGHQNLPVGNYYPERTMQEIGARYRTGGALLGAGAGAMVGSALRGDKDRR